MDGLNYTQSSILHNNYDKPKILFKKSMKTNYLPQMSDIFLRNKSMIRICCGYLTHSFLKTTQNLPFLIPKLLLTISCFLGNELYNTITLLTSAGNHIKYTNNS